MGVCYRPPNQSADDDQVFFDSLQCCLGKIFSCGQKFSAIVLLGDIIIFLIRVFLVLTLVSNYRRWMGYGFWPLCPEQAI